MAIPLITEDGRSTQRCRTKPVARRSKNCSAVTAKPMPDVGLLVDLLGDMESDDPIVIRAAVNVMRMRGELWLAQMGVAHPQSLLTAAERKLEAIKAEEQARVDRLHTAVENGEPLAPFEKSR